VQESAMSLRAGLLEIVHLTLNAPGGANKNSSAPERAWGLFLGVPGPN
jgi:hypothetical protein